MPWTRTDPPARVASLDDPDTTTVRERRQRTTFIRQFICLNLTVAAVWAARGYYDYNPDLRERVGENPLQSIGLLILGLSAIAMLVWSVINHSPFKTVLAFAMGMVTALWGAALFRGISWGQIGSIIVVFIIVAVLEVLILWQKPLRRRSDSDRNVGGIRQRLARRLDPSRDDRPARVVRDETLPAPAGGDPARPAARPDDTAVLPAIVPSDGGGDDGPDLSRVTSLRRPDGD